MRAFILAISLLIAVLPGVSHSIEISPDEPIAFKEELIRKPPVGTSDVMEYWWYPKYNLCMSLEMATSGILKYFPKVNRFILPRDNPGFYAKSTDGLMSLHVAGPEDRIKKIAVHDFPFCIDASRFSMGNWADADLAIEVITGMIAGLSSYSSQSNARNKALDIVRQILSNPWMVNNKPDWRRKSV